MIATARGRRMMYMARGPPREIPKMNRGNRKNMNTRYTIENHLKIFKHG